MTMKLANTLVAGASIGSYGTCIMLPSLKVAFDMGRCPEKAIGMDTVLITHGHMDHIGAIGHHCARRELLKLPPPTYIMGPEIVDGFEALMAAYRTLDKSKLLYNRIVLSPGEEHTIKGKRVVRPFRSHHIVPCQGYGIWATKSKLKAKYQGLPGSEIRDLRLSGVPITDDVEYCEVAFTGDTRIDVVETEETVRTAKLLIMEITFLDDRISPEKAYKTWHVHLDHIIERAHLFENEAILFSHFSARYSPDEVEAIMQERLPASLRDRVTLFLDRFRQ